jgi:hypothetical protein
MELETLHGPDSQRNFTGTWNRVAIGDLHVDCLGHWLDARYDGCQRSTQEGVATPRIDEDRNVLIVYFAP